MAYIFEPEACVSSVTKTAAQRLENWKIVLEQYDYTIMYISGERNCWGDLLFTWVNVPVVAVWAVVVFVSNAPDDTMPSKDAIRGVHQQDRAGLGALMSGASSFTTVTSVQYEPIR